MNSIRATAQSLTSEDGTIATILDLLEDPEDARLNLKSEIEAVKRLTNNCLQRAQSITSKFEYWYLLIIHLQKVSLHKFGMVIQLCLYRRDGGPSV